MTDVTLSDPTHVSIHEGHELSLFVAAISLYNTFNDSHKEDQPWIRTNMQKLLPICKNKLKLLDKKIVFPLQHLKKDVYWNIYLNVCRNSNLQIELNNLLTLNDRTFNAIDFTTNLVQEVLETHRKFCIECSASVT